MKNIYPSNLCVREKSIQTFIPRSKRKRIIKKCKKLYTKKVMEPTAIHFVKQNIIYCHPTIYEELKKQICVEDKYNGPKGRLF